MSVDITARVHIDREPAAVAAYMTDPANDAEWIGGLREAELLGDGPIAVGSRVRRVAYFLRRRVEYVNGILALDQTQLDMESVKAPFPMRITYRFEPAAEAGRASATACAAAVRAFSPRSCAATSSATSSDCATCSKPEPRGHSQWEVLPIVATAATVSVAVKS